MSLFRNKVSKDENNKDESNKEKNDLEIIKKKINEYAKGIEKVEQSLGVFIEQNKFIEEKYGEITNKLDSLLTRDDLKRALEQVGNKQSNTNLDSLTEMTEDTTATKQLMSDDTASGGTKRYNSLGGKVLEVYNLDRKICGRYTNAKVAAERMGFSPTAMSKYIRLLEKSKPGKTIQRSPRGSDEVFIIRLVGKDIKGGKKNENEN